MVEQDPRGKEQTRMTQQKGTGIEYYKEASVEYLWQVEFQSNKD
jgi:hypothetical protein